MNFSDAKINKARHFTLNNGLKTIYHIDNSNPIVCVQLHIRVGSIFENDEQRGFSHFIEHLAFKSTGKYPLNSISDIVPKLGGMINAYTDFDSTCYYLLLPSEHFTTAVEILSELAFAVNFTDLDVQSEKDIIIEEIKQYENEPEVDFIEYIQNDYFTTNPMKHQVLGTVQSIKQTRYKTLRAFYEDYYVPNNAFLVFSGAIEEQQITDTVTTLFSDWQPKMIKETQLDQFIEPELPQYCSTFRAKKKGSTYLAFLLPELTDRHPDSTEMLIAMRILAIGKSSRLYRRLVEEEKICSSVKVSSLACILSGASIIHITPSKKNSLARIIDIFFEEYNQILAGNIDRDEFELVKHDILNSWLYSFESMESAATTIATDELNGDYQKLYTYPQALNEITYADLITKTSKYWKQDRLRIYYQDSSQSCNSYISELRPPKNQHLPIDKKINKRNIVKPSHCPNRHNTFTINDISNSDNQGLYEFKLSSGLKVVYKQQSAKSISGVALSTDICQLMEDESQRGINYLCSTASLYGSKLRDYDSIQQLSRKLGFSLRVSHHLDTTSYRGKCFSSDLDTVLQIISELVLFPAFPAKYLGMIKANSIDNLRREKHYPVSFAFREWQNQLFGRSNNLDTASGSISSLTKLTNEVIRGWHANWNIADQFVLCIISDKSISEVQSSCERHFGSGVMPGQTQARLQARVACLPQSQKRKIYKMDSEQAIINLGGFGCKASDVRANTAFHLLSQIIGGDINSRMFNILREKYGYAYQTGFDFTSISQLGFWNAYVFCDPDDYKASIKLTKEIIKDVRERGVTADELETARNYLIGMHRFDAESVSWQASTISNLLALGYSIEHFLSREERIRSIRLDELQDVAHKWLQEYNIYTHILL